MPNNNNARNSNYKRKRMQWNRNWNADHHQHMMGRGSHSHSRGAEPQGLLGNLPQHVLQQGGGALQQGGGATGLLGGPPISNFREGGRRHHVEEDYNRSRMPVRGGGRPSGLSPWESGMIPSNVAAAPHHSNRVMHHMPAQPMMRLGYQERNDFSLLGPSGMGGALQVPNVAEGLLGGRPDIPPLIGGRMMNMNNRADPYGPPPNKSRRIDNRIGGNIRDSGSRSRNQSASRSSSTTSGAGVDLRQRLKFRRNTSNTYSSSYTKKSNDSSKERSHKKPEDSSSSSRDKKDNSSLHKKLIKKCEDVELPVEAIHCHVCNLNKFSSKKAYLAHLRGKTHEEMFKAFQGRNYAVLNLLRSESKMMSKRQVIAARINGETPKMSQCFKCHCVVVGSLQKHMASIEHKVVNNFQIMKCCDCWFRSRNDIEEHKLSLEHLLKTYESLKKVEEQKEKMEKNEGEKMESEENEEENMESDKTECEETNVPKTDSTEKVLSDIVFVEDPQSSSDVKPYSGEVGTGKTYLKCVTLIDCSVCDEKIPTKDIEAHCKSYDHYSKVLDVLKRQEEGNVQEEVDAENEFDAEELDKSGSKQGDFEDTEEGGRGDDEEHKEEEEDMIDDDYTLNDKAVLDYEFMEDDYEHEDLGEGETYEANTYSEREVDQENKNSKFDRVEKEDQKVDQEEKEVDKPEKEDQTVHQEKNEDHEVDQLAEEDQQDDQEKNEDHEVDQLAEDQEDDQKEKVVDQIEKEVDQPTKEDQAVDQIKKEDQTIDQEGKVDQTVDQVKEEDDLFKEEDDLFKEEDDLFKEEVDQVEKEDNQVEKEDDQIEKEDDQIEKEDDKVEREDQAVVQKEEGKKVDLELESQEEAQTNESEVSQSVENLEAKEEEISPETKKEETEETVIEEELGVTRRSRRGTSSVGVKKQIEDVEASPVVKNTAKRGRGRWRGRGKK